MTGISGRLIVFLSTWSFAANLAAPFFAVYMLKSLGYSLTAVVILTTASQLSNLAAVSLWGNLIDRFSNKAVLRYSAPLFLLCDLAWTFTGLPWTAPVVFYLLLAIHVLMGVATAGVALASGNIAMKLRQPERLLHSWRPAVSSARVAPRWRPWLGDCAPTSSQRTS